jgi:predicted Zn-dependent protease
LTGAAVIATYDPDNPGGSRYKAAIAVLIGQLVNMRFSRQDELESDKLGVRFTGESGYDPRSMIGVMEVLAAASEGQGQPPEFFSTHPNPDRRIERIRAAIEEFYPQGVPENLIP